MPTRSSSSTAKRSRPPDRWITRLNCYCMANARVDRPSSFSLGQPGRFGYFEHVKYLYQCAALVLVAALAPSPLSGQSGGDRLILFGDVVYFYPPGHARNCLLNNQFKRGEPVGFRMNALNPATGKR